jgi:hypothetical protein
VSILERKSETIIIRVTSTEKKFITEKAKNANMNVSEFLINSVQRKRIVAINELPQLLSDIYGVAININQIAKIANSQKFVNKATVDKLTKEADEIKSKVNAIIKSIYEVEPANEVVSIDKVYELLTQINIKLDKMGEK